MPAGSIEFDESILDCLTREVKEETGLDVLSGTAIAIYSDPKFSFTTAYGGKHQMFTLVFLVDKWTGELLRETSETVDARFFRLEELPDVHPIYRQTIEDLNHFDGRLIVK
jgi:ADP-ribose pyrophosphatase YjhB (NUDIX family)